MLVMADDYVGYRIVSFLCKREEPIEVFIYDPNDRGGYNQEMIRLIRDVNSKVEIYSNDDLKRADIKEHIRSLKIELGILAWWPFIISDSIINLTQRGFVNTHPGYLPYNRGKHPYFWCLVDNTPFGVTLHYVDKDIDHGGIIAQKEIPFTWLDTGETLYEQSREEILNLFYEHFDSIKNGTAQTTPQLDVEGTIHYGKQLEPFCKIDLEKAYPAKILLNICRGRMFHGQGAAHFTDGGKDYTISILIQERGPNDQ